MIDSSDQGNGGIERRHTAFAERLIRDAAERNVRLSPYAQELLRVAVEGWFAETLIWDGAPEGPSGMMLGAAPVQAADGTATSVLNPTFSEVWPMAIAGEDGVFAVRRGALEEMARDMFLRSLQHPGVRADLKVRGHVTSNRLLQSIGEIGKRIVDFFANKPGP
jgi:hypothetical protein